MIKYILLLVFVLILFIIIGIKIVCFFHKLLQKYLTNKIIINIISIVPIIILILSYYFDLINTLVVEIYLLILILISKLLIFIISKLIKKEFNKSIPIIIGVISCIILLSYAYYEAHHVLETKYEVYTNKDILDNKFRIIQIADSHIGSTMNGKKFAIYMEKINKLCPDIVVITGDFVDDDTKKSDMIDAVNGLAKLKTKYGVYFVYGNHDKGYFNYRDFNDQDLRDELIKNNIVILEDSIKSITDNIVLIGRKDASNKRLSIIELTESLDKNKYLIVLDHQPSDYNLEAIANVDLVLSGHTHGGQLFPIGELSVLLKINDAFKGIETRKNTTFIVNSGLSDWHVKFKLGSKSEYIVIDIIKK